MTLEDFFTISELKNGLSSAPRVLELLTLIRKEADSVPGTLPEAVRHWSAVAATIAVTDDHHCLDLFLRSGGLFFLDRCLQGAQTSDSIAVILSALERLQAGDGWPGSSPIRSTIRTLMQNGSPPVRDRAAALLGTPPSASSTGPSSEENPPREDSSTDSNMPEPDPGRDSSDSTNNISSGSEEGGFSKPRALTAIELEYGLMDALEVARKVAKEVERELVEEACCSSPTIRSEGGTASARSDIESAPAARCFDLNERIWSSEGEDGPSGAAVSVVSASRAAAAPGRPSVPLQFEGSCGWKGSAVTSAFRPPSPHRRPRPGIDLNVAEVESEEVEMPAPARPVIDLNRAADDGDDSGSHGSMSSSLRARDFDLNGPYRPSDLTPSQLGGRTAGRAPWMDRRPVRVGPAFDGLMAPPYIVGGSVDYPGGSAGLDLNHGSAEGGGIRQLLALKGAGVDAGWEAYSYRNKYIHPPWL